MGFSTSIPLQNIKPVEGGPLEITKIFKKSLTKPKRGRESPKLPKKKHGKGGPSALQWFCISC